MSRARDLSDYVSTGVSAAEFDQLDTTSGTPGSGNFLRGDKTWASADVKHADMWYMTAAVTTAADLTAWSSVTTDKSDSDRIGTAITESSGVFTFPETGIYWIILTINIAGLTDDIIGTKIQTSVDNGSTWVGATYVTGSAYNSSENSMVHNYLFDVASITGGTTRQCKFSATSVDVGSSIIGHASTPKTTAMFVRLGDT